MININLIIKPKPALVWRRVLTVTATGAILLVVGGRGLFWVGDYRLVLQEGRDAAALTEDYRRVISQADVIKKRWEEANRQGIALDRIARNQAPGGQSDTLQAILKAAEGRVALTEITLSNQAEVILRGDAPDFEAAAAYLSTLRAANQLGKVAERRMESTATGRISFTFAAHTAQGGAP